MGAAPAVERPETDLLFLVALALEGEEARAVYCLLLLNRRDFQSGAFDFWALCCFSARPDVECVNVWLRLG